MTIKKALVIGGGIGGLCAAIALRQKGIEVDLIEKTEANDVWGIGIIHQTNAVRAEAMLTKFLSKAGAFLAGASTTKRAT